MNWLVGNVRSCGLLLSLIHIAFVFLLTTRAAIDVSNIVHALLESTSRAVEKFPVSTGILRGSSFSGSSPNAANILSSPLMFSNSYSLIDECTKFTESSGWDPSSAALTDFLFWFGAFISLFCFLKILAKWNNKPMLLHDFPLAMPFSRCPVNHTIPQLAQLGLDLWWTRALSEKMFLRDHYEERVLGGYCIVLTLVRKIVFLRTCVWCWFRIPKSMIIANSRNLLVPVFVSTTLFVF